MGKLIDELKAMGYEFQEGNLVKSLKVNDKTEEVDVHELRVKSQEGQIILLKRDMTPMLFPGKDIDGVRTTCGDVYRDFYELDDEATSMLLNNYSLRTYNYLKKERDRVGLLSFKEGIAESFFVLDEFNVGMGIGLIETGRYADGRFVAQSSSDSLYEDSDVLRMHFSHLPDEQDVGDALIIRKMERDLKLGRHRETFRCSDCLQERHWLDIPGTIKEKLAQRMMRKCGCTGGSL